MRRLLTIAVLALPLAACAAAPESGIRDAARFRATAERTTVTSARPVAALVQCFRDSARLLPGSTILPESGGRFVYTAEVAGFFFEEAVFAPAGRGSTATMLLAPGVNARWRADFARDRLDPLKACALR